MSKVLQARTSHLFDDNDDDLWILRPTNSFGVFTKSQGSQNDFPSTSFTSRSSEYCPLIGSHDSLAKRASEVKTKVERVTFVKPILKRSDSDSRFDQSWWNRYPLIKHRIFSGEVTQLAARFEQPKCDSKGLNESGKSLQFQPTSNFTPISNDQPRGELRRLSSESGDIEKSNYVTKEQEQFLRYFRKFPNTPDVRRCPPDIKKCDSQNGQINISRKTDFEDVADTETKGEICKAIVRQNRAHPVFKCDQCNRFLKLTIVKEIDSQKIESDPSKTKKVKSHVGDRIANFTKAIKGSNKHQNCMKGCICGHIFEENKSNASPCKTLPNYRSKKPTKLCRFRSRSNPPPSKDKGLTCQPMKAFRVTRTVKRNDDEERHISRKKCNLVNTKLHVKNNKTVLIRKCLQNKEIQISQNVFTKATWTSTDETCTEVNATRRCHKGTGQDTREYAVPSSPRSMHTKMHAADGMDTAIWNNMEIDLKYLNYQKMMLDKRTRTLNQNIMSSEKILRELSELIAEVAVTGIKQTKAPERMHRKRPSNPALNLKINNFKMAFEDAQQKICGYEDVLVKSFEDKQDAIATNKNLEKLDKPLSKFNPLVSTSDSDSLEALASGPAKPFVSVSTCLTVHESSSEKVKNLFRDTYKKLKSETSSETEISSRVVCPLLQSINDQALLNRTKREKEYYANSNILSATSKNREVKYENEFPTKVKNNKISSMLKSQDEHGNDVLKNSKLRKFVPGRNTVQRDSKDNVFRNLRFSEESATSTPPGELKKDTSSIPAALSKRPESKKRWRY